MPGKKLRLKKIIGKFFRKIDIRVVLVGAVLSAVACFLIYRLFVLQIINGQDYLDSFQLRIRRQIPIEASRGNIYDRNGNILAYNDLAYSVVIRDTYEDTDKDKNLNTTISRVYDIVESNGDTISLDFDIVVNSDNDFVFSVEGTQLLRFLADIYGHSSVDDLKYEEQTKSAPEIMDYLCERYGIGETQTAEDGTKTFVPGEGYTDDPHKLLAMVAIRYELSLNSYQRYLSTSIATDVSTQTVAEIKENSSELEGVDIEEDTVRRYTDGQYFSHIIGYTGKISTDELAELKQTNPDYSSNDIVGKAGIEKSLESELQGTKGSETVYVDNLGNLIEVTDRTEAKAGNDVYLTIDKDLQEAATDILEKHLAQIILAKLRNVKENTDTESASSIIIPVYDVYYSVFNNNIIDISHLSASDASETEKKVYDAYSNYLSGVMSSLDTEMRQNRTPYKDLPKEYENYETIIIQYLYEQNILLRDEVDTDDATYKSWAEDETISMSEYIEYCIRQNWIDTSKLDLDEEYTDSSSVFNAIVDYLEKQLPKDSGFRRKVYKYVLLNDSISGEDVCQLLIDQGIVNLPAAEEAQWESGAEDAYTFMINRIQNLDLTPAELALDPHSGSMVITDVNTGDVLAMVSYPSYDNNRMSNGVDAEYYAKLQDDLSSPLLNYATQQRTAPGSTFKMVSATAGLCEGVIDTATEINCTGTFTKIGEPYPHCWIYPGAHGLLNVTGGITNSCNDFFYEVGYRLGSENGEYDSDTGTDLLQKYASEYGLNEKSGVEIEEYDPQMSDMDAVRSAIGQGDSGYTTTQLSRYVTAVANSGTVYNLTLVDKIAGADGTVLEQNSPTVANSISMDQSYWDAIHEGMRGVIEDKSYFQDFGVNVAGKTGTAQESTSKPNHALFVCYAPYEKPEIAIATRIANGYTSDYAAQTAKDVLSYYFGLQSKDEILSNNEQLTGVIGGD